MLSCFSYGYINKNKQEHVLLIRSLPYRPFFHNFKYLGADKRSLLFFT